MMWLVLDLPGAAVPLKVLMLNVNCLLLFVGDLLATNQVLMRTGERWLQRGAQGHLLVPLESV